MREDFIHYLWQFQKWQAAELKTCDGQELFILSPGSHNLSSGPDFFNARVVLNHQEWAGNVEIHINSSDWYSHHHEIDSNYDNVILHVVWNHDTEVFRKDNSAIPVLEIKNLIEAKTIENYKNLLDRPGEKWINCEKDFHSFSDFQFQHFLERLYVERLEEKAGAVFQKLENSSNNWEEVLFKMLCKNFGLNVNGEAFLSLANAIPFSIIRKTRNDRQKLEALFLGEAGLLEKEIEEPYYQNLQREYHFLRTKYNLDNRGIIPVKFFRLRPDNFPNLRLAQLSSVYHQNSQLFSEIIEAKNTKEIYRIFEIALPEFWETHYTFQKSHLRRKKPLSKNFIDLLIINTLVPLKFCFARQQGKDINEEIMNLMTSLKPESNQIIKKYEILRPKSAVNALQSQALLQLKRNYCEKHQCLKCTLGVNLLQGKLHV